MHRRKSERGTSLIEFVVTFLIIFYLFVGALDFGFFGYSLISVQNAARVGALYTSSAITHDADQVGACTDVIQELKSLPNYSSFSNGTCNAAPLVVSVAATNGPDSEPASQVTVTYQTLQLIPIPGLPGSLGISSSVLMRVLR